MERFAGTAARSRKFAEEYKLGRVHGGKWKERWEIYMYVGSKKGR